MGKAWAYYNEWDSKTAAWLRELIREGLIADGEVDTRSIVDVRADDVRGFTQCHFFAGIGGWSYALRLAGWSDDRAVWTGSCPCQPFSLARKNAGLNDPRHLWPYWCALIRECRPPVVFGEQVESAIRHGWLDLVCDDLEREDYSVGAACLPAASTGAFHVRQRLWFVADTDGARLEGLNGSITIGAEPGSDHAEANGFTATGCDVSNATRGLDSVPVLRGLPLHDPSVSRVRVPMPTDRGLDHESVWAFEWTPCFDGKWRAIQPGLIPVVDGLSGCVGRQRRAGRREDPQRSAVSRLLRCRSYGNAIVPPLAAEFIKAYREAIGEDLHGL